jgi:hypothetical protein
MILLEMVVILYLYNNNLSILFASTYLGGSGDFRQNIFKIKKGG